MVFPRISGSWARASVLLLSASLSGCIYGFRGGGGLPDHIRTIYIAPFENQTDKPELDPQIFRALNEQLPRALGLRLAGEQNADLVVTGKIVRYDDVASNYRPGQQNTNSINVELQQVSISLAIQLVDVRDNLVRWESSSLVGRGEYKPSGGTDEAARTVAIKQIIQQVVDGAQSQW
ncbi:MAG: DUF4136 domain-containing protein [Gemmatimonadetes bacterium]|nr:DUF4136 domain-containing protein [Gemmatimonadota bacterium]